MGCGCNKNRPQENRVFTAKAPNPSVVRPNLPRNNAIRTNTVTVSQITRTNPDIRKQICRACPFSTKNAQKGFDDNSRCRKANKSISFIMRDINFLCPVQKF
jgi:hypothetical protein